MFHCISNNRLFAFIIFSILFINIACLALAETPKSQNSLPLLVQQIGGIRPASSHDPDVVDKYGEGFFVQNEGHGGGRYYVHPSKTYTFHVEIGVDKLIEDIELIEGVHLPQDASIKSALLNKLPDNISIDHGIRFGMTRAELIAILGQPHKSNVKGNSLWLEYHTSEDSRVFLAYDAYYEFKNNQLIRIRVHDGC